MQALVSSFGIDWKLLLAQAVNFGIVLIALRYFLYKPVLAMLENRRAAVAKGVEDATRASADLARADAEAAKRVSAAEGEAEGIVATARESAMEQKAQLLKDAEARAAAVAKDAEERAKETAERALRESEREVARLAVLAAEKVLRAQV